MSVAAVNIRIEKGTDFESTFTINSSDGSAFNLANYSATAKIRKHPNAGTAKTFSTTITSSTGEIKITMSDTDTSELSSGRNYYDVIIQHSSTEKKTKVFEGMALVSDTVSL